MDINIENLKEFLLNRGISEEEIAPFLNNIESKLPKKYGLVWEDKEENVYNELLKSLPILKEVKKRKINTNNDKPVNMLIEGDNLHSLKSLQYTHKGAIQVAYLDPPYNTGNKDFIYNDRYVDKEDTWRHSNWLSFMDKRLRLVKELLADDGVIFISIDDNELYQLKLLCDEIFGESNFISNMVWKSKSGGANDTKHIANDLEYILVYAKKIDITIINKMTSDTKDYKLSDKYVFERGKYKLKNLDMGSLSYGKALDYEITAPDGEKIYPGGNYEKYLERQKGIYTDKDWGWRWSKNRLEWGIENGFIEFKKVKGIWKVYSKQYELVDNKNEKTSRVIPYRNLIDFVNTTKGQIEIKNIFEGVRSFSYPKPIDIIKFFINLHPNKNAAVLDCFAGSGTTGHAVLDLNKEDGGNRQFILCTNNENNICEEVTYQRLNKVINGYTTPKGKEVEGLGGNLNYYKVELKESLEDEDDNIENMINDCTDLIAIKENAFTKKEVNAEYDILTSDDKVVMMYKNIFATSQDVLKASSKLKRYKKSNKVIYALNTSIEIDGIDVREFPIEIINKVKTRK